jgi:hypothetical protein
MKSRSRVHTSCSPPPAITGKRPSQPRKQQVRPARRDPSRQKRDPPNLAGPGLLGVSGFCFTEVDIQGGGAAQPCSSSRFSTAFVATAGPLAVLPSV